MFELEQGGWNGAAPLAAPKDFACGYCGREVSAAHGYSYAFGTCGVPSAAPSASASREAKGSQGVVIALCPHCGRPTLLEGETRQIPAGLPGRPIGNLPGAVELLFLEARLAMSAGAYTGSVLLCRKLLSFVAVQKGSGVGRSFLYSVNFLAKENYLPPNSHWLAYVQARSNEAGHELSVMGRDDAQAMISFAEAVLRFVYELPNQVPSFGDFDDLLR